MTQCFLRNRTLWALALAGGLTSAGVAAQQPPAAPVPQAPAVPAPTPAPTPTPQVGPLPTQQPIDRYVVGQATPEPTPGTDMLTLTLEEAINMALDKNLELKVARMAPQLVDYQLQSARAAFRPPRARSSSFPPC